MCLAVAGGMSSERRGLLLENIEDSNSEIVIVPDVWNVVLSSLPICYMHALAATRAAVA